ncbi:MAG: aconitate hydratase AcnA [Alphaproteobacteria bacterium]
MTMTGQDSLKTRRTLDVDGQKIDYYSLEAASKEIGDISRLPYSLKILLENLLRHQDERTVHLADIKAMKDWLDNGGKTQAEIAYRPARVLMQDFTGVPAVVDLAAMRDAMVKIGGDPQKINPLTPCDLVIDHSVMVDHFGNPDAFKQNVDLEYDRNQERYEFLRWGQSAFNDFRVVPPGTGICHQVNLEYLAKVVWSAYDKNDTAKERLIAYPDTCVGTDSHTTMINGLGVLGWGVGGIEAEAAMLGQPVSMLIPQVVGFRLKGKLREGMTATDLVLTVTHMLRKHGVVGKFVEFFGDGLAALSLANRATISNMAPEYGATCGIFPIDAETLSYMRFSGRDDFQVALTEHYAKAQGMWLDENTPEAVYSDVLELDLDTVLPSLAGPKRPQDLVKLDAVSTNIKTIFEERGHSDKQEAVADADYALQDGAVVIAAITSCTNTSNPAVLIAAGLVAKKAAEKGLSSKPWVKTSLAPGSQVVSDYLEKAGLQSYLDQIGFNLVGYGCTTCIGNSGPLPENISNALDKGDIVTAAVLSGNRNFEGRVSPQTRANYLASPPLVVAYALAGNVKIDLSKDALGKDQAGNDIYLKDIWPSNNEIESVMKESLSPQMYQSRYSDVFKGSHEWQKLHFVEGETYHWNSGSTYIQNPPYFEDMKPEPSDTQNIMGARPLLLLGDSITTDHISPAGSFKPATPAGEYLQERQVRPEDFNSYGSRRGNHEIMMRGTFANVRIKNQMLDGVEGGYSKHFPSNDQGSVYDIAMRYRAENVPLVIFGGKEYGTGSSRDWAAKGTILLGVKAVIVESFERIHRSNLVGMGVLPLQFEAGTSWKSLGLTGDEMIDLTGIEGEIKPAQSVSMTITNSDGNTRNIPLLCRIDTLDEAEYYRNGGILHFVLRNMAA